MSYQLGQYYTTNYEYILKNIDCIKDKEFIEPFVGNGCLLEWLKLQNINIENVEIYDIQPKNNIKKMLPNIVLEKIKRNTLLNPPKYDNKFLITNPPYLAKNKCKSENNKILFEKYDFSDLYRIFIHQFIKGNVYGGIIIIPLNFWSSFKKQDIRIRNIFLKTYKVDKMNIFEERVFENTSYTVCSFRFIKNSNIMDNQNILISFYPIKLSKYLLFEKKNNWIAGGEIYNLIKNQNFKVNRLTKKKYGTCEQNGFVITNIFANLLDTGNKKSKIRLEYKKNKYIGKESDRVFATIIIKPLVDVDKYKTFLHTKENQIEIINKFNKILNEYREKYHSLFLSNYREAKNGDGRKRCSFNLCYGIIRHILSEY